MGKRDDDDPVTPPEDDEYEPTEDDDALGDLDSEEPAEHTDHDDGEKIDAREEEQAIDIIPPRTFGPATAVARAPEQTTVALDRYRGQTIIPLAEMEQLRHELDAMVQRVFRKGVDYDPIPGTDGKPVLLKPGAEKALFFCRLTPRMPRELREVVRDWTGADHGGEPFFFNEYTVQLYRDGEFVCEGVGSCNSWEKKYRRREAQRACPICKQPTVFKSKPDPNRPDRGGWYCWTKKGGCGMRWPNDNEPLIVDQQAAPIPNPDIHDLVNTIDKMAQKRALLGPTLIATGLSSQFTQDDPEDERSGWSVWAAKGSRTYVTPTTKELIKKAIRFVAPNKEQREAAVLRALTIVTGIEDVPVSAVHDLREDAAQILLRVLEGWAK